MLSVKASEPCAGVGSFGEPPALAGGGVGTTGTMTADQITGTAARMNEFMSAAISYDCGIAGKIPRPLPEAGRSDHRWMNVRSLIVRLVPQSPMIAPPRFGQGMGEGLRCPAHSPYHPSGRLSLVIWSQNCFHFTS